MARRDAGAGRSGAKRGGRRGMARWPAAVALAGERGGIRTGCSERQREQQGKQQQAEEKSSNRLAATDASADGHSHSRARPGIAERKAGSRLGRGELGYAHSHDELVAKADDGFGLEQGNVYGGGYTREREGKELDAHGEP